jgi:membrane protein implicated in regulation of membrane protease activity
LKRSSELFIQIGPQSRLGRTLAGIMGMLMVGLALFFFFTLFLVFVAVVLAALAVALVRLIWSLWHTRTHKSDALIDGEYYVAGKEAVTEQSMSEEAPNQHQVKNRGSP